MESELKAIKLYIETMHENYLNLAKESLEKHDAEKTDGYGMKEFYLKNATKYLDKADVLLKVRNFMLEN